MSSMKRGGAWLVGGILLGTVLGCGPGGSEYTVAPVSGRVVVDGQPVQGGSVTFRPVSVEGAQAGMMGKPASAEVGQDGTFVLSTYGSGDGAVVGRHKVTFTPFVKGAETYEDTPAPSPYAGMVPKTDEVDVQAGSNQIEIELVKMAPPAS